MVYIPLGIYMSKKTFSKNINWIILILGLILIYITNNQIIDYYLLIITSVALFGIIKNISIKEKKIYLLARKSSLIIYLIHMYVWNFYYMIIYGKIQFGIDSFLVTSIISILTAITYLFLKEKNNISKKLTIET